MENGEEKVKIDVEKKLIDLILPGIGTVIALVGFFNDGYVLWVEILIKSVIVLYILVGLIRIIVKTVKLVKQIDQPQRKLVSREFLWIAIPRIAALILLIVLFYFSKLFPIKYYIDKDAPDIQEVLTTVCYDKVADTPTPTSTNTITPTPTLTLTPTPTLTPTLTITPSPTLGLESACIPEIWGVFPPAYEEAYKEVDDDGCATFTDMYISGIYDGFKIYRNVSSPTIIWGLIRKLDLNKKVNIQFTIYIEKFYIRDEMDKGFIYFGLINPDDYNIYEDMFRIQKNGTSLPHFYIDRFTAKIEEIPDESEIFINLTIDRDGTLNYFYRYNGYTSDPFILHYSDKNDHFFIGYELPKSSILHVEFLDFQFVEY